jgi:hypothetical protein
VAESIKIPAALTGVPPIDVLVEFRATSLYQNHAFDREQRPDCICVALEQVDLLIAALDAARKYLSAGHGAQGEPATVQDKAHETPGRQSIPEVTLKRLLDYIECQSGFHGESHRAEVLRILEDQP